MNCKFSTGRKFKKEKPLIYVFCEGESELVYADFLKRKFSNYAVINVINKSNTTKLFEEAYSKFKKDKKYKSNAEETDEIWFFFDVEKKDIDKWDNHLNIIKQLRKLKNKPGIKVRLLMTTACIEYWLMLHYKMYTPYIESVSDKNKILAEVISKEPNYKKGDYNSTIRIAEKYPTAVKNAEKVMKQLVVDGLPSLKDTDERNQWLYKSSKTFSTVYEAINYLEDLKINNK